VYTIRADANVFFHYPPASARVRMNIDRYVIQYDVTCARVCTRDIVRIRRSLYYYTRGQRYKARSYTLCVAIGLIDVDGERPRRVRVFFSFHPHGC